MATEFIVGHCYYDATDKDESPRTMICKKSLLHGKQLIPYSGLLKFPLIANNPNSWVDCTEQVRRSEALRNASHPEKVPVTRRLVGTIIAFEEDGGVSAPHLLYDYKNDMAYLMRLDAKKQLFNLRLTRCYPLQQVYQDIASRAVSSDPIRSSVFDGFFRWLRKTSQYNDFVMMVEGSSSTDTKEDMIHLFELMSTEGVTAKEFEARVDTIYNSLPKRARDFDNKYAAVLASYDTPARGYSTIEWEIMRITDFKYKTPKDAWSAVGSGKPFPTSTVELEALIQETTPNYHTYICDNVGLYSGDSLTFWSNLPNTRLINIRTDYKRVVDDYLRTHPDFNMGELDFIKEEDKEEVFRKVLGTPLDSKDPYRAWTKNPPQHIRRMKQEKYPDLSYVEIFHILYSESFA